MWRRLILVAGAARSGTTWLNAILGSPESVSYIRYEPLMVRRHPETPYGKKVLEWRSLPIWHRSPDDPSQLPYKDAVLKHVESLCKHYFGGPVDTFIIKDPHPQYVPFLLDALSPDHVVVIRRHPLGVINSYDKDNLYKRWDVETDFKNFCSSMPEVLPEYQEASSAVHRWSEQIAFMAHAGHDYLEHQLSTVNSSFVDYEDLCLRPEIEARRLFEELGWEFTADILDSMKPLIYPLEEEIGKGFQNLKKRSEERAYAWRSELSPIIVRHIQDLFTKASFQQSFPGDGLPALTADEKRSAWRVYLVRRWKVLRRRDIRGLIQYLNP